MVEEHRALGGADWIDLKSQATTSLGCKLLHKCYTTLNLSTQHLTFGIKRRPCVGEYYFFDPSNNFDHLLAPMFPRHDYVASFPLCWCHCSLWLYGFVLLSIQLGSTFTALTGHKVTTYLTKVIYGPEWSPLDVPKLWLCTFWWRLSHNFQVA